MNQISEFKSFYKTVGGNEGSKCSYPTRLDCYGRGCSNNCSYCYAKSLLDFRQFWNPEQPAVADIKKIRRKIKQIEPGTVLRLGGMTDCFQSCEQEHEVTYETIKALNDQGVGYLIVTKCPLVAKKKYMSIMDKQLAHIQISITTTDDQLNRSYEHTSPFSRRVEAIERLERAGFDVTLRLSPFIPEYVDYERLSKIQCHKILVEFLRVNSWIRKWFDLDYSGYTLVQSGYRHMPLDRKIYFLQKIYGFSEMSVCDDVTEHYDYWRKNVNHNPKDCCNLAI